MAFEFRLQKLLEYRENQKKIAEEELARRQREVLSVQQEIMRLQAEEERLLENHRTQQGSELNIMGLIAMENYRCFLQRCHQERMQRLQKAEKELERQRNVVMESWRSCRSLTLLREKAEHNYLEEEKVSDQRLNDELSINCYMRQKE